jgi:hypothetical protein
MNFNKKIKHGSLALEASFIKICAPREKFFVVFKNNGAIIAGFDMVKNSDRWTVIYPAPEWVVSMQEQLSDIISNSSSVLVKS